MRKTFKYRLLSNNEAINKAELWINLCRRLYNIALEQRIYAYANYKKSISYYYQNKQLPDLKNDFPEYKTVDAQVLLDVLLRLEKSYKTYFRRIKKGEHPGLPRFKGKDRYSSFTLYQNSWKLDGKYLTIRNIGRLKLRLSRPIDGVIKTITIHREQNGHWYAIFSCDKVTERKLGDCGKSVGIDVGIKTFCVDSDNNSTDTPQYFRKAEKQLRIRNRKLSRKVKCSNRRNNARILVAKTHEKVRNQRNDFLHKVSNYYIKNYGAIYVEKLYIPDMARKHLAYSISDASWGKFFEYLSYKAEEAGRVVIKVPRFEPTSKTCSNCGEINKDLTLNDRQWVCKSCGILHDRDYNAAKNIKRVGQTQQALTCGNSQGVACESPKGECQTSRSLHWV